MSNLTGKNAAGDTVYIKATGDGTNGNPHIIEHLETNSAAILAAAAAIQTACQLMDDAVVTDGALKGILAAGHDGTNPQAIKTSAAGAVYTSLTDGTSDLTLATAGGDAGSNTSNRIPVISWLTGFNGTTWDRLRTAVSAATSTLTGFLNTLPLAIYNSSAPSLTNGQVVPLQLDSSGNLKVVSSGSSSGRALKRSSASFTRPADVTAYSTGDVICNSTSSPTILEFSNMAASNGGLGRILGASITSSNNPSTNISARLFLFSASGTVIDNDNSAFTPTDTEIKDVQGVIIFAGAAAIDGDASSNIFNGTPVSFPPQGITYKCGGSSTSLYGILVADAAYTPANGEELQITLEYEQG